MKAAEATDEGVRLRLEQEGRRQPALEAEMLLVAVGRAPVTDGLGLEELGVGVDARLRRGRRVDADRRARRLRHRRRRRHPQAGPRRLARGHRRGRAHGRARGARRSTTTRSRRAPTASPRSPRRPHRGRGAASAATTWSSGKFPFSALGKATILGDTRGFVKIVARDEATTRCSASTSSAPTPPS